MGTGQGFSVLQVCDSVEKVTGKKIATKIVDRREGDSPVLIADSSKAFDKLKWSLEYSKIETIVSHAWRWYRHRFCKKEKQLRV